ncbi:MAG TPA: lysophospholipid acyltransferase family protein [Oligoflexia bacterium]|nr:lysophospholipid acyltransferase family protein [Oligoflexia bacterium]HMP48236.1 lysophospholipid acyltransferase family protein [Oligoflexia bacterium]
MSNTKTTTQDENLNDSPEALLPPPSIAEYLVFPFFLIAFISTLILFEIIQRANKLIYPKNTEYSILWFNRFVLYSLRIALVRLHIEGKEKLPKEGPAVVISNHQSMFDISSIHVAVAELKPRFVAKKELGQGIPGVSTCLRYSNAALIDRSDPAQALPEIERFAKFLKEKKACGVIFPEGTRARSDSIKSFKKRGPLTLMDAVKPAWIIPVTIQNSWKLQARKRGPLPLGVDINLKIHTPLFLEENGNSNDIFRKAESMIRLD